MLIKLFELCGCESSLAHCFATQTSVLTGRPFPNTPHSLCWLDKCCHPVERIASSGFVTSVQSGWSYVWQWRTCFQSRRYIFPLLSKTWNCHASPEFSYKWPHPVDSWLWHRCRVFRHGWPYKWPPGVRCPRNLRRSKSLAYPEVQRQVPGQRALPRSVPWVPPRAWRRRTSSWTGRDTPMDGSTGLNLRMFRSAMRVSLTLS